jgi:hypothetical protein
LNSIYPNAEESIWPTILDAIANGQSLSSILRREGMPSYSWAKLQLRTDPGLRKQYDQALEDRGDRLAEELIELAFTKLPDNLDGRAQSAWVQHLRVKIDVLKWTASKLRPRVYGERLDVSVINTQISITQALELAEKRISGTLDSKAKWIKTN